MKIGFLLFAAVWWVSLPVAHGVEVSERDLAVRAVDQQFEATSSPGGKASPNPGVTLRSVVEFAQSLYASNEQMVTLATQLVQSRSLQLNEISNALLALREAASFAYADAAHIGSLAEHASWISAQAIEKAQQTQAQASVDADNLMASWNAVASTSARAFEAIRHHQELESAIAHNSQRMQDLNEVAGGLEERVRQTGKIVEEASQAFGQALQMRDRIGQDVMHFEEFARAQEMRASEAHGKSREALAVARQASFHTLSAINASQYAGTENGAPAALVDLTPTIDTYLAEVKRANQCADEAIRSTQAAQECFQCIFRARNALVQAEMQLRSVAQAEELALAEHQQAQEMLGPALLEIEHITHAMRSLHELACNAKIQADEAVILARNTEFNLIEQERVAANMSVEEQSAMLVRTRQEADWAARHAQETRQRANDALGLAKKLAEAIAYNSEEVVWAQRAVDVAQWLLALHQEQNALASLHLESASSAVTSIAKYAESMANSLLR